MAGDLAGAQPPECRGRSSTRSDRDWAIREILGVDADFEYEVITREDWVGRRLVANRFRTTKRVHRRRRAHLWVPYASYGMNAGIADAINLSWLLAARLQGWGTEAMLDAYEAERQPITEQVSNFAMDHAQKNDQGAPRQSRPTSKRDWTHRAKPPAH